MHSVYDPSSLMHYGKYSFSENGKPTIQLINDPNHSIGQRVGPSAEDLVQLNALYHCQGKPAGDTERHYYVHKSSLTFK